MSLFSDNIRALRAKEKISQEKLAEQLQITRGRYVKYEDGTSEAPYEILKKIALYFHISIDLLLSVDVRKIAIQDLLKLENNRLLLPIQIDTNGENIIEIVTEKAKAGYLSGFADPEYIESLQQISLPFLGSGKHRGFPVEGDSMPPHEEGSIIVGRYVEKLGEVIWEYQCNIGRTDKKNQLSEMEILKEILLDLKREVSDIKENKFHH
jgi:transcriptional regulator with XRE-family HTH domain